MPSKQTGTYMTEAQPSPARPLSSRDLPTDETSALLPPRMRMDHAEELTSKFSPSMTATASGNGVPQGRGRCCVRYGRTWVLCSLSRRYGFFPRTCHVGPHWAFMLVTYCVALGPGFLFFVCVHVDGVTQRLRWHLTDVSLVVGGGGDGDGAGGTTSCWASRSSWSCPWRSRRPRSPWSRAATRVSFTRTTRPRPSRRPATSSAASSAVGQTVHTMALCCLVY